MGRLLLLFLLIYPLRSPLAEPGQLCRAAILAAEREYGIPPQLLVAIGRVESGRRDPNTGAHHPWPWTINAEGRGQYFPSRDAAIAEVQALQARGVRSIDVGCMQVNLRHHPNAFANLDAAFDPAVNAHYAARFLAGLRQSIGDWHAAAAAYHSHTPEFAVPYRARVLAAWAEEQARAPVPPPLIYALPPVATSAGTVLSAHRAERGVTAGTAGRGLDSYRAEPVLIVGRAHLARARTATKPEQR
jgi:hypothetical protein